MRPSRPDFAVSLEAVDHQIPLGLVLPEVPEELFLFGVVLPYALKTPLDKPLDVGGVQGQAQAENLAVVAVVVADGRPPGEAFFSSPAGWSAARHGGRIPGRYGGVQPG